MSISSNECRQALHNPSFLHTIPTPYKTLKTWFGKGPNGSRIKEVKETKTFDEMKKKEKRTYA